MTTRIVPYDVRHGLRVEPLCLLLPFVLMGVCGTLLLTLYRVRFLNGFDRILRYLPAFIMRLVRLITDLRIIRAIFL